MKRGFLVFLGIVLCLPFVMAEESNQCLPLGGEFDEDLTVEEIAELQFMEHVRLRTLHHRERLRERADLLQRRPHLRE